MTNRPLDLRTLAIIRIAYLGGVLMFGGVTYFLHHQGAWHAEGVPDGFKYFPVLAVVAAMGGMAVLRPIWARATDVPRRASLTVIGWAIGEGAALAGAVYYFLSDDAQWYITGMLVLILAFFLFPIRSDS